MDIHVYADPVAERNKAREAFVARRTVEEQKFQAWYQALLKCPKEKVLDKIPFDYADMSIQKEIPEWYAEVPRADVCEKQVAALNEKIDTVNKILYDINQEGLKLLQEYNALYAGGK